MTTNPYPPPNMLETKVAVQEEQIKNLRYEHNEMKSDLVALRESVESLRKSIYLAAISFAAGSGGIAAAILKAVG